MSHRHERRETDREVTAPLPITHSMRPPSRAPVASALSAALLLAALPGRASAFSPGGPHRPGGAKASQASSAPPGPAPWPAWTGPQSSLGVSTLPVPTSAGAGADESARPRAEAEEEEEKLVAATATATATAAGPGVVGKMEADAEAFVEQMLARSSAPKAEADPGGAELAARSLDSGTYNSILADVGSSWQGEAKAKEDAEAKAKADADTVRRATDAANEVVEARLREEATIKAEAEAESESEMAARLEAEAARAKAEAEAEAARAKADADAESVARAKAEAAQASRAKAEAEARLEADAGARVAQEERLHRRLLEARLRMEAGESRFEEAEGGLKIETDADAEVVRVVREGRFRQIEAWAADTVRRATDAANEVVEARLREEATIKAEAEAESESEMAARLEAEAEVEEDARLEAEAFKLEPIEEPEVVVAESQLDADKNEDDDDEASLNAEPVKPELIAPELGRQVKIEHVPTPFTSYVPSRTSFWETLSVGEAVENVRASLTPDPGVLALKGKTEAQVATAAASYLARAASVGARAAVTGVGAVVEAAKDSEVHHAFKDSVNRLRDVTRSPDEGRREGLDAVASPFEFAKATAGAVGQVADAMLSSMGHQEAGREALNAAGEATQQLSSFFAAVSFLGINAGGKAKEAALKYQKEREEGMLRAEAERIEERRRAEHARKLVAEMQKTEEERIAAEQKALEEIRVRVERAQVLVEEERIAAERAALEDIRTKAEANKERLRNEIEQVVPSYMVAIADSSLVLEEEKEMAKPYFFGVEIERVPPRQIIEIEDSSQAISEVETEKPYFMK